MKKVLSIATCLAALILVSGCKEEAKPSPTAPIDFAGRPTYRSCAATIPLTGKWEAGVSHGYFSDEPDEDFDFVEVTLELPQGGGNVLVPFDAAFSLRDLPKDVLMKETKELVSFDAETNTVTFDLGTAKITTQIPQ